MLQPLTETQIAVLMVAGAAFAVAGIILLIRRSADRSSARIEIFGLKFQVGSAGLVVFMLGFILLVLPTIAPTHRPIQDEQPQALGETTNSESMPLIFESSEEEPNDLPSEADGLDLVGQRTGTVRPGEIDWFKYVPTIDVVRFGVETEGEVNVQIYDSSREVIRSFRASRGLKTEIIDAVSAAYYVSITGEADENFYAIWVYDPNSQ